MAPNPTPSALPIAPNRDEILNRISLSLAKHQRILATLSAPPSSSPTAAGFSSLGGASRPQTRAEREDAEFDADRALPPNAGVGWRPEPKAVLAPRGKADRMLEAAARRAKGNGRAGRARGVGDEGSESEAEEGRSALGRRKRRKVGDDAEGSIIGGGEPPGTAHLGDVDMSVEASAGGDDGEEEWVGLDDESNKVDGGELHAAMVQVVSRTDTNGAEDADEKRRKRKREKKKRRRERAKQLAGDG